MFALDRLMVVMPLEHVIVLNESVFNATIKHGEILKLTYSQKVPALLNIKIDYENSEAVIEFTGKILGERYKELIRLTNIKQCNENLSNLDTQIPVIIATACKLGTLWHDGDLETKRKIQKLVYPSGVFWDKENRCYRTENRNKFFDILDRYSMSYGKSSRR